MHTYIPMVDDRVAESASFVAAFVDWRQPTKIFPNKANDMSPHHPIELYHPYCARQCCSCRRCVWYGYNIPAGMRINLWLCTSTPCLHWYINQLREYIIRPVSKCFIELLMGSQDYSSVIAD